MEDLLVLISQTSGTQSDVLPDIKKLIKATTLKADYKKVKTPPEIATLLKEHRDLYKAVAVYGGDGSIIAALKTLAGSNTLLLILPGGTANTIAHDLSLPLDAQEIIKMYLRGTYITSNFDIALSGKRKFVLDMHTGFWTRAIANTPRGLKKRIGALAYGVSAIKQLPNAQVSRYELTIDGRQIKTNAYMILLANQGFQNLLGLPLFKYAHRSGLVQIALIKSLSPIKLLIWLVGKIVFNQNYGGAIKTYRGHKINLIKSPTNFVMDDGKITIKLPLAITGSQFSTKVMVEPQVRPQSRFSNYKLYISTLLIRFKERLRRFVTGRPLFENTQLATRLFVGGAYRDGAYKHFKNWNITGIVNMRSTPSKNSPEGIEVLHLKTKDWSAPALPTFEEGVKFINKHITDGGGVYVHCRQGEGRGPTMAAAYLIHEGMTVEQALDHIKRSRPMSHPNRSQRRQLAQWQEHLKGRHINKL